MCWSAVSSRLQAAEASQKKLEEEVAAFLYMLKHDGLAESKTSYFIVDWVVFCVVLYLETSQMWTIQERKWNSHNVWNLRK